MNKKFLALALAAMSLTSLTGLARTTASETTATQETAASKTDGMKQTRTVANPFEGMDLSDSQKEQLKQLDEKQKADRKAQAQVSKQKMLEMRTERRAKRQAARKAYLDEVKAIIGTENYVAFLENIYVNGGGHSGQKASAAHRKHKANGDRKGHRTRHSRIRTHKAATANAAANSTAYNTAASNS